MHPSRDEMANMLARQILGFEDYSRRSHLPPAEVSAAQAHVEINLKGMVREIRRQVWIDNAAIAAQIEHQLEEAASEASIAKVVAAAVANELADFHRTIADVVRKRIHNMIEMALVEKLGDGPKRLAGKVAEKMWDALYGLPSRKGDVYGYGADKRHTGKKSKR